MAHFYLYLDTVSPSSIEETWRLWCKFLEDYSHFEDWLKKTEHSAANPNSAHVLYTVAKDELKKFEVSAAKTLLHLLVYLPLL